MWASELEGNVGKLIAIINFEALVEEVEILSTPHATGM